MTPELLPTSFSKALGEYARWHLDDSPIVAVFNVVLDEWMK
jgi:hypothetical protein